jgi:murein DD-endopeptidase MepM/ murein hydrolase activator NlpD
MLVFDLALHTATIEQEHQDEYARLNNELIEIERLRKEEADLYRGKLLDIVTVLYEREEYSMGGFETEEGADVTAVYEAIVNYSRDYRDVLSIMGNYFQERSEFLAEIPSVWPIEYNELTRITSGFGWRLSPVSGKISYHTGIDIAGTWNAEVFASADGIVVEHWVPPGGVWQGHDIFGGMVKIRHSGGFETVYAHLKWTDFANVHEGREIKQGDRIGIMGSTGVSTGQHLHYEVRLDGVPVNPLDYLRF